MGYRQGPLPGLIFLRWLSGSLPGKGTGHFRVHCRTIVPEGAGSLMPELCRCMEQVGVPNMGQNAVAASPVILAPGGVSGGMRGSAEIRW